MRYGTLPIGSSQANVAIETTTSPTTPSHSHTKKKIQAGDTVLSLIENEIDGPIPVSIQQVIQDFQELNDGLLPEQIQIGKVYTIPIY